MTDIDEAVVQMVAAGDRRRAARADTACRTLSRYERRILREAAVMGYVLGHQNGRVAGRDELLGARRAEFPRDIDIVRSVLQHCDSTHDLYPYLADACAGRRRRITKKRMWHGEAAAIDHITSKEK